MDNKTLLSLLLNHVRLIKNTTRNQTQSVVIGIGVNIDVNIDCQTPWTDLHSISTQKSINQFDLTKDLISQLLILIINIIGPFKL
jgi:biotin-(acetyl-CoA carboxylase) ligase